LGLAQAFGILGCAIEYGQLEGSWRSEEFDVPVSFHLTGMVNPLIIDKPTYVQSQPTVLQGITARHPRLPVQIGHGGYPWLSETKAILRTSLMPGKVRVKVEAE